MALTICHECGKPLSSEATACPQCGAPADPLKQRAATKRMRWGLATFVIFGGALLGWFLSDGFPSLVAGQQSSIEQQVVVDAMKQMNTAIEGRVDPIQVCVYAQMVTAAIIQAKDSAKLAQFQPTQERLCDQAGLSR